MAENILHRLWLDKQILAPMIEDTELNKFSESADHIQVGLNDRDINMLHTPTQPTNEQFEKL